MAESNLSKHVRTVITSLATAALGWVAFSIQELKVEVAVLAEKVDQLEHRAYVNNAMFLGPWTPDIPQRSLVEVHALPANYSEPKLQRK